MGCVHKAVAEAAMRTGYARRLMLLYVAEAKDAVS